MRKFPIYAPKQFWANKELAEKEDCNGCGSELDLSGTLVPDTIYGLDIRTKCCIHDFMYKYGLTWTDKIFADVIFLYNMVAVILNKGGILTIPRLFRATKYFVAVARVGDRSFEFDKEIISDERMITFKGEFR
jgi:hypothetical protein